MSELRSQSKLISNVRRAGDAIVASITGEIDLHNSPEVRTELLRYVDEGKPSRLVLNLAGVPYMDSSAIAVLVEALQRLRKQGGKIYLTQLQPRVKGLLEIARLDTIFILADSEETALAK
jgi:anti-sigma B factor antagonist